MRGLLQKSQSRSSALAPAYLKFQLAMEKQDGVESPAHRYSLVSTLAADWASLISGASAHPRAQAKSLYRCHQLAWPRSLAMLSDLTRDLHRSNKKATRDIYWYLTVPNRFWSLDLDIIRSNDQKRFTIYWTGVNLLWLTSKSLAGWLSFIFDWLIVWITEWDPSCSNCGWHD